MTHFRGYVRGPHWGLTMDSMLIDFWGRHACLFNSSDVSFNDRELKTRLWSEFAASIGKSVSEVERRSRSLRTQYGRLLGHPERVTTPQHRMLREKLAFLRPYILRRRGESSVYDDGEEEVETEGSIDQEMESSFGSPLGDADVTEAEQDDSVSVPNPDPQPCPIPPPQVTDIRSLSLPETHRDEVPADQPDRTANTSRHDVLNQFAEVMLADMRHIKDPLVLMRLRRDITDLVFKAVEEDEQRRGIQVPRMVESRQFQSLPGSYQSCSQGNSSWRERILKRRSKGCESGRRTQRWEEMRHLRRMSRSHLLEPVQQGQVADGTGEHSSQAAEIKRETEQHVFKIEEETLTCA